jgi:nucleoside-diphosphate-sugar epimerase
VIDRARARSRAAVMHPIRSLGKFVLKHFTASLRKISQENRHARELMQYIDKTLKTNPRTYELSLYNREALYVTTKARNMLGYQPTFGVDRGLDFCVEWLRSAGLVEQLL